MSSLKRLNIERRAESFGQRRVHHVEKEPRFHRFAGELFGVSLRDKVRQQETETRQ